ncbi:MAG TPA: ADP-dependent glucokinase/phosphofructokinase, partial [Methanothrix sp.]|nr:ADP-dependent glucokinase/phosphofructokinase [Methanothrix sp.]
GHMNIICAYTVNLDAVHDLKGEEIAALPEGAGEAEPKICEKITGLNDLVSSLLFCMRNGSGAELLIERDDVARMIGTSFSWHHRLGGNAGIMANVLAARGAMPVLNAPALSRRMAGMLHPGVRLPLQGKLVEPVQAADEKEMVHFVFEFAAGTAVKTRQNEVVARKSNRLIATFDPFNSRLCTNPDFDSFCSENTRSFDGALISGFHLLPFSGFREIYEQKIAQIASWREGNPELYIHAEMGSFQRPEMMKYLVARLPADSLGLNEDELAMICGPTFGWRRTLESAMLLMRSFGLQRVAVHTRDYILSVMLDLIPVEEEAKALTSGADAAAALASTGSMEGKLPVGVNPLGIKARNEFIGEGATPSDRGAFLACGEAIATLVPSLLVDHPKFTVGLGDTATATIFHEELKARIKEKKRHAY